MLTAKLGAALFRFTEPLPLKGPSVRPDMAASSAMLSRTVASAVFQAQPPLHVTALASTPQTVAARRFRASIRSRQASTTA
jgi:hypothetical protein